MHSLYSKTVLFFCIVWKTKKHFIFQVFLLLTGFFLSFLTFFPSLVARVKKGFLILFKTKPRTEKLKD